ncbi:hypothetical protein AF6_1639 [Anoxybacillus flavithermus TNO-09.006]|nr:hypothetical protein AF6_1639 [Anoxybacillus flavithermus TNO-09.006]OAO82954.1 Proline dehydrogenase (Proline oxidase) [Anoxybacillus flavithermus]
MKRLKALSKKVRKLNEKGLVCTLDQLGLDIDFNFLFK